MNANRRTVAALASAALGLAGCWSSTDPSALPQRTEAEVQALVQSLHAQRHAPDAASAGALAGLWEGLLTVGDRTHEVEGVALATGFVALRARPGPTTFTLRSFAEAGGTFTATLERRVGTEAPVRFVVTGPAGDGRLDGFVLPVGWTFADVQAGVRQATEAERASFGRLVLERADVPGAAATPMVPVLDTRRALAGNTEVRVQTDAQGNLALDAPGCVLRGGIVPSASVAGVYEWAGTGEGAGCAAMGVAPGAVTGAAWASAAASGASAASAAHDTRFTMLATDGQRTLALRADLAR